MRITKNHILVALIGCLVHFLYLNITVVNIPVKKTLIAKIIDSRQYGTPYYYYRWRLENGKTESSNESFNDAQDFEIGKTYIFNEQKITFK